NEGFGIFVDEPAKTGDTQGYRAQKGVNALLAVHGLALETFDLQVLPNSVAEADDVNYANYEEDYLSAVRSAVAKISMGEHNKRGTPSNEDTVFVYLHELASLSDKQIGSVDYQITVGTSSVNVTMDPTAANSLQTLLVDLAAALTNSSDISATSDSLYFEVSDQEDLTDGLVSMINIDRGAVVTATNDSDNVKLTIAEDVALEVGAQVMDLASKPQQETMVFAGVQVAQQTDIIFSGQTVQTDADGTVTTSDIDFDNYRYRFTVTINHNGTDYAFTSASIPGDANWTDANGWATALGELEASIKADNTIGGANAANLFGTDLVTSNGATRTLSLTAAAANDPFVVSASIDKLTETTSNGTATVTTAAGTSRAAVQTIAFDSVADADLNQYNFSINVDAQSINVDGATYQNNRAGLLNALSAAINTEYGATVTATVVGNAVQVTHDTTNTSLTLSGNAENKNADAAYLDYTGDKVVILNTDPGDQYLARATGSLTVVRLPVGGGETIRMEASGAAVGTKGDLVLVAPLNVGNGVGGGSVELTAAGGLTLGGTLTANNAVVSSGKTLSLTTDVDRLSASITSGDFTLEQTSSTDLVIQTLSLNGGDVDIRVAGNLTINNIVGDVGRVRLVSTGGSVTVGKMSGYTSDAAFVVDAVGDVSLGTPGDNSVALSTLDVTVAGALQVNDDTGVIIEQYTQNSSGIIDIEVDDDLIINARLTTTAGNALTLNAGGNIVVNQRVTSADGAVTLAAGAGISLAAAGDIVSDNGVTSLTSAGALFMEDGARLNAGSGAFSLDAGGSVTLGSLASLSTGNVTISSGAVIDGGDSDLDIDARSATLVISAAGGIGASNAIETRVAALDITNTGTGDINIVEFDDVTITRIDQQAANADVSLETLNGDIIVDGRGVETSSGNITLYAGAGAISLSSTADDPSIRAANGFVHLTAEGVFAGTEQSILVDTGIQVSGQGDITLNALGGNLVTSVSGSKWLHDGTSYNDVLEYLLVNGYYFANAATGEVVVAGLTSAYNGLNNGDVLRAAGGSFIRTDEGSLTFLAKGSVGEQVDNFTVSPKSLFVVADNMRDGIDRLKLNSQDAEAIRLISAGSVTVGDADGQTDRGGDTKVINLGGTQTIKSNIDAGGEDLEIVADDIDLRGTLRSSGANLTVRGRIPDNAMIIGDIAGNIAPIQDNKVDPTTSLHIDRDELSNIQGGFDTVQIGQAAGANGIWLLSENKDNTISFKDNTVLNADGIGGEIYVGGDLTAPDLTFRGSGNTTTIAGDVTATPGSILVDDSARILGDVTMTSAGTITLGTAVDHYLTGDGAPTTDQLTLTAQGAISIAGVVGKVVPSQDGEITPTTDMLEQLIITQATDVTFDQDIVIEGDLIINATGTVTFGGNISLSEGGDLRILGAESVVFANATTLTLTGTDAGVAGTIEIEADEITFGQSADGISGAGEVILRQTTRTNNIAIGLTSEQAGQLDITLDELNAFADGFSQYTIGHEALNNDGDLSELNGNLITIGAASNANLFNDDLDIFGGAVSFVQDADNDKVFRLGAGHVLNVFAQNTIDFYNQVEVDTLNLVSHEGSILQRDTSAAYDTIVAKDVTLEARTGVSLMATQFNNLDVANDGDGAITIKQIAAADNQRLGISDVSGDLNLVNVMSTDASSGRHVNISVDAGALTVDGTGIAVSGNGDISLQASGNLTVLQGISGNAEIELDIDGSATFNADIETSNAQVMTVRVDGDVAQNADLLNNGGRIRLFIGGDLTMNVANKIYAVKVGGSGNGEIDAKVTGDVIASRFEADDLVTIDTEASLTNNFADSSSNIISSRALLSAVNGVGLTTRVMVTDIDELSVENTGTGNIMLADVDDLDIVGELSGGLGVWSTGSSLGLGQVDIRTKSGDLNVLAKIQTDDAGFTNGSVQLTAEAGSIQVASRLETSIGFVSLKASDDVVFTSSGNITARGGSRTIDVLAETGSVTMDERAKIDSNDRDATNHGNVRVEAAQDITLGRVTAGEGQVTVKSSGALLDADVSDAAEDLRVNINAQDIRLEISQDIGQNADYIEIDGTNMAAESEQGSIYIDSRNDMIIGVVGSGQVLRGGFGTWSTINDPTSLSGVHANFGQVVSIDSQGSLTIDSLVTTGQNGTIRMDVADDLTVTATGDIVGARNVDVTLLVGSDATVDGQIYSSFGSDIWFEADSITMGYGAEILTVDGHINMQANDGDIALGRLTTNGAIAISGGQVTNNLLGSNDNITASRVDAQVTSFGTSEKSVTLNVDTLTMLATGSVHVENRSDLDVRSQDDIVVGQVNASMETVDQTIVTISNFTADGASSIRLNTGTLRADQIINEDHDLVIETPGIILLEIDHLIQAGDLSVTFGNAETLSLNMDIDRL
ncbi:MAG: hypothetical protein ACPGJH_05095, partial [Alphaproteobacteria bacterium]